VIDQPRARTYQSVPRSQDGHVGLRLLSSWLDWRQQLWIQPGQTSQILRVDSIVLSSILVDQAQSPRIGQDDLVPQFLQQTTYPRRMGAHLERDAQRRPFGKSPAQRGRTRTQS
jgi:hypothetical protein